MWRRVCHLKTCIGAKLVRSVEVCGSRKKFMTISLALVFKHVLPYPIAIGTWRCRLIKLLRSMANSARNWTTSSRPTLVTAIAKKRSLRGSCCGLGHMLAASLIWCLCNHTSTVASPAQPFQKNRTRATMGHRRQPIHHSYTNSV